MSVGYDHIDLEACAERGVKVGFTPDVLTNAVAELTMALLLSTSRRLKEGIAVMSYCVNTPTDVNLFLSLLLSLV